MWIVYSSFLIDFQVCEYLYDTQNTNNYVMAFILAIC